MSLNAQVSAERVHIGFFGLRNAGKSSLVNRVTGQELSVVSEVRGTTTDPVRKAMELLPLGPVVIIDTPGLDDTWLDLAGESGQLVRLESFVGWQAAEGAQVECEGWLNGYTLAICVSKLRVGSKIYNYYPRLWRLLLPWFLVGAGLLWSILQKVGL